MGIRSVLHNQRVYVDTNIIIYLLEGYSEFQLPLFELRDGLAKGEFILITSELTLCEALVVPFRKNNSQSIALYRQFLENSGAFDLRPTTRETYLRASLYRAQAGLKTPDALHIATALEAECGIFLSNDRQLKSLKDLRVINLSEFI